MRLLGSRANPRKRKIEARSASCLDVPGDVDQDDAAAALQQEKCLQQFRPLVVQRVVIPVPLNQLRRGDLLFYATNTSDPNTIHHVGIYIGNGMMVDAPYTGAFVRIDGMYQPGGLIGAIRPAG